MKNLEFNIEKSTMRELTTTETEIVGGGVTTTLACVIVGTITLTWPGDAGSSADDGIFDDGFDERP